MGRINLTRLKECMLRAEDGAELTIGFLGGSITQGSLATKPENCYAYRVFSWWKQEFGQAVFHYVNGGIGGTTSHFGVSRAETDVLMYQPDVVFVDFSVNDDANTFFQETYEGVIRKLLTWQSKPAVILLNNVYYDTGKNAQEYHNAVGDWYQLPHISIKDTLYQKMKSGSYTREELTQDGLHPNDKGHELVAAQLIAFLERVKADMHESAETDIPYQIPNPMTANAYEQAKRLTIREITPKLEGFRADTEEKAGHLDCFKNGWIGKTAGDKIFFEIPCSCLAVQYRKTVAKPALCARLILDNDTENTKILDGNFDEDWGDCLYLEPILHHGKNQKHTIAIEVMEIEVMESDAKEATPFYLLSLIIA